MLVIGLLSHEKKTMASLQPITKISSSAQGTSKINPPYSISLRVAARPRGLQASRLTSAAPSAPRALPSCVGACALPSSWVGHRSPPLVRLGPCPRVPLGPSVPPAMGLAEPGRAVWVSYPPSLSLFLWRRGQGGSIHSPPSSSLSLKGSDTPSSSGPLLWSTRLTI